MLWKSNTVQNLLIMKKNIFKFETSLNYDKYVIVKSNWKFALMLIWVQEIDFEYIRLVGQTLCSFWSCKKESSIIQNIKYLF